MKIISESGTYSTTRRVFYNGKDEQSIGNIVISITAEHITTEEMVNELEKMAYEMADKAKKIVAAQIAPQQIHGSADAAMTDGWLRSFEEHHKAADDNPSEC